MREPHERKDRAMHGWPEHQYSPALVVLSLRDWVGKLKPNKDTVVDIDRILRHLEKVEPYIWGGKFHVSEWQAVVEDFTSFLQHDQRFNQGSRIPLWIAQWREEVTSLQGEQLESYIQILDEGYQLEAYTAEIN